MQGTITKIADQTGVTNHSVIPPADQTLTVKSVPTVPHPVMVHAAR